MFEQLLTLKVIYASVHSDSMRFVASSCACANVGAWMPSPFFTGGGMANA